jgi:carbon starvation protein
VALCLACILAPGDYFAINTNPEVYATLGMKPVELYRLSDLIGMNIQGRVGGVSSLAISASKLLSSIFRSEATLTYWYNFTIVYLGIFIMPIMDHGTRMARYFVQDALGIVQSKTLKWWLSTIILTLIMAFAWAYLLYNGTIGVVWPMFGICNQLMACISLIVATSYILKHLRPVYGFVTFWPVLIFAPASIHGAFLKITNELLPSGTTPAYVQALILMFFTVLFIIVLTDALRNWLKALCHRRSMFC